MVRTDGVGVGFTSAAIVPITRGSIGGSDRLMEKVHAEMGGGIGACGMEWGGNGAD